MEYMRPKSFCLVPVSDRPCQFMCDPNYFMSLGKNISCLWYIWCFYDWRPSMLFIASCAQFVSCPSTALVHRRHFLTNHRLWFSYVTLVSFKVTFPTPFLYDILFCSSLVVHGRRGVCGHHQRLQHSEEGTHHVHRHQPVTPAPPPPPLLPWIDLWPPTL